MLKVGGQLLYCVFHEDAGYAYCIYQNLLLDGNYINSLLCHNPLLGSAQNRLYCCWQSCCLRHHLWWPLWMDMGIGLIFLIIGTSPGMLFLVTHLCVCGVFLRARFDVGLQACMIGGASVMRGMMSMGDSSFTLCSSSLTLCSTLSVAVELGGVRIALILDWSSLMNLRPVGVAPAMAVASANLSMSACKCWCAVKFDTWQCCGKSSGDLEIQYAHFLGCNTSHICYGLGRDLNTIRPCLVKPKILLCHRLCMQPLCIPVMQGGTCSNRTVRSGLRTIRWLDLFLP